MDQRTHAAVSRTLVGTPVEIEPGRAAVELRTTKEMAADERGLVHGSFPFGAADYAAMLAVNEPTVVLGTASMKFHKPVVAGETIRAEARVTKTEGKKRLVTATVFHGTDPVMECEMLCIVPERHVLERK